MKTILICGATGFIGRNLTEYFSKKEGYKVRAVYHLRPPVEQDGVEWIYADLNNKEDVKKVVEGVDIVLQYAATTSGAGDIVSRPYIHVTDNAVMNSLILRECYESGVGHFVFPSCTVMYQPRERLFRSQILMQINNCCQIILELVIQNFISKNNASSIQDWEKQNTQFYDNQIFMDLTINMI